MLPCVLVCLSRIAVSQSAIAPPAAQDVSSPVLSPAIPANAVVETSASLPDAPAPMVEVDASNGTESTSRFLNPVSGADPDSAGDLVSFEPSGEAEDGAVSPGLRPTLTIGQCPDDKTHARECRPHWRQLIITSSIFNAFQNTGNLYTSYWYRYETTTGAWFQRWFNSDLGWRWGQWHDGNPFLDEYVGHPMMGAITGFMWIQNDPKGMAVDFGNNREYWHSRLVSMVYSAAYSFEWKFGPFGEAGVGHNGDHPTDEINGVIQNDTGDVELVTTPVGGFGWTIAEDILDKYVVQRFEEKPRGPLPLLVMSFLTPARATANIFRFRPPWYRDGHQVKAHTFWSEPQGPDDVPAGEQPASGHAKFVAEAPSAAEPPAATANGAVVRNGQYPPVWPHYGGVHEFGAWWGLSLMSGHIWGYAKDIKYMPIDVNYSYLVNPHATKWNFRYAPEMTALAMLDQPTPGATIKTNKEDLRERFYGSGVSPVGFRASFFPASRVQPYVSGDGGFIYFGDRVLSPQGSQYMYTVDYGAGLTFYRKQRQSFSIGYRYQHLSNANISLHNPGTDANTFYVAISRYRTKGYR